MSAGQAVAYLIMLVRRCRAVRETGPVTADSDAKVLPDLLSLPALPVRTVLPALLVEVDRRGAALLVQRLQHDPDPPGVAAVVLDECHERHLDTDLALAFLVDVRAPHRPHVRLVATSATAEAERLAAILGAHEPVPVVTADSAAYPVELVWCPPARPVVPAHGLRVDPRLLEHV